MGVEEVALALLVVVVEVLDVGAKDRRCSDRQSVSPGLLANLANPGACSSAGVGSFRSNITSKTRSFYHPPVVRSVGGLAKQTGTSCFGHGA